MSRLEVRVQPGAKREGLLGWMDDGVLKLAVAVPPEGGRANDAAVALLARALGIGRRSVTLVRGGSSRSKQFEVEGLEPDEVRRRLSAAIETGSR